LNDRIEVYNKLFMTSKPRFCRDIPIKIVIFLSNFQKKVKPSEKKIIILPEASKDHTGGRISLM